jgi:hypothetical protein
MLGNPEDSHLGTHLHENIKSYLLKTTSFGILGRKYVITFYINKMNFKYKIFQTILPTDCYKHVAIYISLKSITNLSFILPVDAT